MRYEKISVQLIEQKTDESTERFIQRVNKELVTLQERDDIMSVIPFPTQSLGGMSSYHLMIMTRIPQPDDYKKWNDDQSKND